jgi:hypothetical protein
VSSVAISMPSTSGPPESSKRISLVLRLVALLLALAAITKAYAALQRGGSGILWLQVIGELGLGAWLMSGLYIRSASRIALIAFIAFASASLFKILGQSPDCGCFGNASISPSAMFLVDLTIVALLACTRPFSVPVVPTIRASVLYLTGIILIGVTILTFVRHRMQSGTPHAIPILPNPAKGADPSPDSSQAKPKIEPGLHPDFTAAEASATQWIADLGTLPKGKTVSVLFHIASPNHQPLQIRGVTTSCGCTSMPNPPRTIPASGAVDVEVIFHVPDHVVTFDSKVLLTTSDLQMPPLILLINGAVGEH